MVASLNVLMVGPLSQSNDTLYDLDGTTTQDVIFVVTGMRNLMTDTTQGSIFRNLGISKWQIYFLTGRQNTLLCDYPKHCMT